MLSWNTCVSFIETTNAFFSAPKTFVWWIYYPSRKTKPPYSCSNHNPIIFIQERTHKWKVLMKKCFPWLSPLFCVEFNWKPNYFFYCIHQLGNTASERYLIPNFFKLCSCCPLFEQMFYFSKDWSRKWNLFHLRNYISAFLHSPHKPTTLGMKIQIHNTKY